MYTKTYKTQFADLNKNCKLKQKHVYKKCKSKPCYKRRTILQTISGFVSQCGNSNCSKKFSVFPTFGRFFLQVVCTVLCYDVTIERTDLRIPSATYCTLARLSHCMFSHVNLQVCRGFTQQGTNPTYIHRFISS